MKITLYKNCKLNNAYKNVFAFGVSQKYNDTLLNVYLDRSLQHVTINVDNTYQERSGSFTFELEDLNSYGSIYDYNYMKIVSDDNILKRYCFIDDIELVNDLVKLYYSEDIWHSYGASMKMTKSLLSNNRNADKTGFYNHILKNIPLEYEGNEPIKIVKLENNTLYNVVVEAQIYDGAKVGEVNERSTFVFIIETYNTTGLPDGKQFSITQAQEVAQKIISSQSLKSIGKFGTLTQDYFINIQEIYILPIAFNVENFFYSSLTEANKGYILVGSSKFWETASIKANLIPNKDDKAEKLELLTSYTLFNNFKRRSIGTFGTQIPLINNGAGFTIELLCFITKNDFKLFINVANQLTEITDDFKYNCPFVAVNGEENSMLNLNRHASNISKAISIVGSVGSIGQSISNIGSLDREIDRLSFTKTGRKTKSVSRLKYIDRLRDKQDYERSQIVQTANNDTNMLVDFVKDNAPFYSSTSSKNVVSTGIENAVFGICYYEIQYPLNEYLVDDMINENGYKVFEIIDNFEITGLFKTIDGTLYNDYKYNYIKFETINIYGNFPRSIAQTLEDILLKGTKIWFNELEIS